MSDSNEHISKEKTNTKTSLAEDINSKSEKYRMDSLNEFEKKADEFSQKAKKDLVIKKLLLIDSKCSKKQKHRNLRI